MTTLCTVIRNQTYTSNSKSLKCINTKCLRQGWLTAETTSGEHSERFGWPALFQGKLEDSSSCCPVALASSGVWNVLHSVDWWGLRREHLA